LANSSGNLSEQTNYDSFGNSTNNLSTRYQFTGKEYDNFTGLHYFRARFYDAKLGRFISEDPIGLNGGDVNIYNYVGGNPQNFTDPSGLQSQSGLTFLPEGELYAKKWYKKIEDNFNDMRKEGCACEKSFKGFGIDLNELGRKGMFIGSGDTLTNSSIKTSDLHISVNDREKLAARNSRASTLIGGEFDQRPHTFFFDAAKYNMMSPISNMDCNLRQAFAHELMHAGGVQGQEVGKIWQLMGYDDLSYLNTGWWSNRPYSELLSNCGCK
jgi:RHS repeat-associated protein